jgi:lysophospholipase L1-like esterase
MRSILLVAAGAVLCPAVARCDEPTKLMLQKGERIVFLGDSITQAGASAKGYVTIVREELKTHRPDLMTEVIGAGISGNKVPDLEKRLQRDVLDKKPTLVVIYIGINDVWHGEKDPARGTPKDRFEAGLKELTVRIKASGAKVILCTPSVIGEKIDGANTLDKLLDEYSDITRKVAKEERVPVCDLRKEFLGYLKEKNAENKEKGVLTSDRVHLNETGNRFVAERMLHCLGE